MSAVVSDQSVPKLPPRRVETPEDMVLYEVIEKLIAACAAALPLVDGSAYGERVRQQVRDAVAFANGVVH